MMRTRAHCQLALHERCVQQHLLLATGWQYTKGFNVGRVCIARVEGIGLFSRNGCLHIPVSAAFLMTCAGDVSPSTLALRALRAERRWFC
jgi:hypothetical protein